MRNHFKYIFTTIFLLFFVQLSVNVSRGDKTSSIHTPIGGSPVMTGTATAIDSVELDPLASNQRDYNVRNRISFGVDMQYPKFVSRKQSVEVSVNVKQFDENNTALSDLNFKLNIAYNHRDTLKSTILDDYEFSDAYKIIFKIDTIRVNGDLATTLPENLFVQGDIFVERYSELSTTTIFGNPIQFLDVDCNNSYDGIHFSWPDFQGAEEYQLEFMHVSDYGVNGSVKPEASLNYDFRNNSTRITTSKTFYNIGLLFDRGWIAYRVRPVGVDINDPSQLIFGEWSVATTKSTLDNIAHLYKIQITNAEIHENSLNWQYSATYAEQGKRKEVITYYDGSLRNRQAVTKVNSNKNVVVGETIYDHQGRPTINVLPTPVVQPECDFDAEPVIKYYTDFNLNLEGQPYSKNDFDKSLGEECSIGAKAMIDTNGASQYYSPKNPNKNLHQAYVPDADGYPFQQIEYTPDNTGRINRQGGVGPDFQIGSGKESKYLYGNPNQLELNRLFGSEVGYSQHYQKNAVIDANGQVSVSYIDISGKVIATALTGASPENMEGLTTVPNQLFKANHILADGSNQIYDEMSNTIVYSSSFIITSPTRYSVDYKIYTLPMVDSCLIDICVDCVYELELSLKDDCGVNLLSDSLENVIVGNFQLDSLDNFIFHSECVDTTSDSSFTEVYLPIGKYTVYKTLKISQEAISSYMDLVNSSNCVLKYTDFYKAELQSIDTNSCLITCDNCIEELGTLQNFISSGQGSSNDYHSRVKECKMLCKEKISDCEMYFTMMQIDFSKGGQYAEYLDNSTGALDLNKSLSIFNENNHLPNNNANWRNPILETPYGTYNIYVDENGDRSRITLFQNTNNLNVFMPAPQNNNMVQYDSILGEFYIYPEQLQSVEDFIDAFEHSWSLSLVKYHPEYCYYESCIKYAVKQSSSDAFSSQSFDDLLLNTHTFLEAQAVGFIDGGGVPTNWFLPSGNGPTDSSKPYDPFVYYNNYFDTLICSGYVNKLKNQFNKFLFKNNNWYSMQQVAAYTVRCGSEFPSYPEASCFSFGQEYNNVTDTTILNSEWRLLKSMYISAKQGVQQDLAQCKAIAYCSSYNGCIGNTSYTPFPDLGIIPLSNSQIYYAFVDENQPCSVWNSHLYRNKVKRFSNHNDVNTENANSTSYELYLQTGQCPNAFSLQHLLNDLALSQNLTASNYDLNLNNFLSALFQSNNTYNNPGPTPSLNYDATVTSNTITANWIDDSNSSVFATMNLYKTASENWSDIIGIINLVATGPDSFSAEATYMDSIIRVFPINGTISHFKLDGCTFDQECVSNDLALDLTTVFNILSNDDNLFSSSALNLENYVSSSMGANIRLTSIFIENAAGVGNNLSWQYLGNGKVRVYNASSSSIDGLYIEMDPAIFDPSIASSIEGFYPMTTTGNYSFEIEVVLNSGGTSPLVGIMYQVHDGDTIGISTGNCDLPIPNTCKGVDYEVFRDLGPLLENALTYYDGSTNINLYTNIFTTSVIVDVFPFGESQTTSVDFGDSLVISAGECDIVISLESSQYIQFENLIAISELELTGDLNLQSGYNSFVFEGTFSTPLGNVQAVMYGNTCFSLKDCNPCSDGSIDSTGSTAAARSVSKLLKDLAVFEFSKQNTHPKTMKSQLAFYANEGDVECEKAAKGFNKCIDEFNQNYPIKLPYFTANDMMNYGWCNCTESLCNTLSLIIDKEIKFANSKELIEYLKSSGCLDCKIEYEEYKSCIETFNSTYKGKFKIKNIIKYEEFINKFDCKCASEYCTFLNEIVAGNMEFDSQDAFDNYMSYADLCNGSQPPIVDPECEKSAKEFNNCVKKFNSLDYPERIRYVTANNMMNYGWCNCTESLCNTLSLIIDKEIKFANSKELIEYLKKYGCLDCKIEYEEYKSCIKTFNSTYKGKFKIKNIIKYEEFINKFDCKCASEYCTFLNEIVAGNIEFDSQDAFDNYVSYADVCNGSQPPIVDPECEKSAKEFNNCVKKFNSLDYPIKLPYFLVAEMETNGWCGCVESLCKTLNSIIDDKLYFANSMELIEYLKKYGCLDCEKEYINYKKCVEIFNITYKGDYNIKVLDYEVFSDRFNCKCATDYCALLNEIVAGNIQFGSQEEFDNYVSYADLCDGPQPPTVDLECEKAAKEFNKCIDKFNSYDYPIKLSHFTAAEIENKGWCYCVEDLCMTLDLIIDKNIYFVNSQELINFLVTKSGCIDCEKQYEAYLNCVKVFNSTFNDDYWIESISFEVFVNEFNCQCVEEYCKLLNDVFTSDIRFKTTEEFNIYVSYSNLCDSTSSPITGPECEKSVSEFNHCIDWFNAQGYPIHLPYFSAAEMESKRWCYCVESLCSSLEKIIMNEMVFSNVNDIIVYLTASNDCVDCKTKYAMYLECVNNFISYYSGIYTFTNQDIISYETFVS